MGMRSFTLAVLVGSLASVANATWYCPPGWEEYKGQCWKAAEPEAPAAKVSSSSRATSSASAAANSTVTVNNQARSRQSAASAIVPQLNGYGFPNCFGDVNPSGSFVAGLQTFGWGVAAGSSKASNVCAVAQLAGPEAALRYLQKMDRNVPHGITPVPQQRVTCPAGSTWDGRGCWKSR